MPSSLPDMLDRFTARYAALVEEVARLAAEWFVRYLPSPQTRG